MMFVNRENSTAHVARYAPILTLKTCHRNRKSSQGLVVLAPHQGLCHFLHQSEASDSTGVDV